MLAAEALLKAEAFDACCFHAQQAVEKLLKAFLIQNGLDFPFTHNLVKLLNLAEGLDRELSQFTSAAKLLTPFAVELRYDHEFCPTKKATIEALAAAKAVASFLLARLPKP